MSNKHIDAKTRSRIRSALRKIWLYSNARRETKARARIKLGVYVCEECNTETRKVEVDHYPTPVGATPGSRVSTPSDTWDSMINKMFCGPEGMRVLCKDCHNKHTKKGKK